MAGGIAHDFHNLIAVVMGNAGYLHLISPQGEPAHEVATELEQTATRGAALVRQLLAFSRNQVLAPRIVDVGKLLTEFIPLARTVVGRAIAVETRVAAELWPILVDPGQLEQVLMNLTVNARDAHKRASAEGFGGTLTIEVRNETVDDDAAERLGVESHEHVVTTFADTGTGMDAETMARVFDPFFTTKGPLEGTGLGLATVHGIVTQSGGVISVASEVGKGTTFTIRLPRAPEIDDECVPTSPKGSEPSS